VQIESGAGVSVDALSAATSDSLISSGLTFWPVGATWGSPDGQAAPTTAPGTNTTQVATTAFVTAAVALPTATQAEQEAVTSNTLAVTPGTQIYHPTAARAFACIVESGGDLHLVGKPRFFRGRINREAGDRDCARHLDDCFQLRCLRCYCHSSGGW